MEGWRFTMTISDVICKFNTTPFLFVGSGMTRRYYGLPDWKGLLKHFALEIKNDPFTYSAYESRAKALPCPSGLLPKVATLIQREYDEKWFAGEVHHTVKDSVLEQIKNGLSPFKAEIAAFINRNAMIDEQYKSEIEGLCKISEKSITGIITTNYDAFLETHFPGFKKYVGQGQLIFSPVQGVAEIYKIHGSIEKPSSLIINETDYLEFDAKSPYLASKLMTIFMEYPIIFMGYSIGDSNIQNILKSIVSCLDTEQLERLQNHFVFVEFRPGMSEAAVTSHTIMIDGKLLPMTRIILSDFLPLYSEIGKKRSKVPVRILRRFKEDLYSFVVTNAPTGTLRVASIEDERVQDEDMVLAIGRADKLGIRGLSGITGNEWYRNIILGDLVFSADELLEFAYPVLLKQNSNRLPIYKYLTLAEKKHTECEENAAKQNLDTFIPPSILKNRGNSGYHSAADIWAHESSDISRVTRLISQLPEHELKANELEIILKQIFENRNILEELDPPVRSCVRKMILIYDYLKWGPKAKEPSD